MTATQDVMIAELQCANAELRQERDASLTQRASDYDERIVRQAASIEVLKAIPGPRVSAVPCFRYPKTALIRAPHIKWRAA